MKSSVPRRLTILLTAACLLLCSAGSLAAEIPGIPGDLNNDRTVDASDALAALQHSVGLRVLPPELQGFGDLNGDAAVDASDALLMLQYSVGLVRDFPHAKEDTRVSMAALDNAVVYTRHTEAVDPGAVRTTYQNIGAYVESIDLPIDSMMVYINWPANVNDIASWKNNTDKEIWAMLPAYRDGDAYFNRYPKRRETESEQSADGTLGCVMPNPNYTEFKWEKMVEPCINAGAKAIVIEEPIPSLHNLYAPCFKEAWKEFYGEDWVNPNSSPEVRYRASKLAHHMAVEMIKTIGERIKEKNPDVLYYLANHNAYRAIGEFPCINSAVLDLDCVDGFINQSWSNTSLLAKPYAGNGVTRPFQTNYIEYGNAVAVAGEKTLFTLSDPLADYADTNNYDQYVTLWQEQLAAQLLQPEVQHFQNSIWTGRHFGEGVPQDFMTAQLSVFQAMNDLSGKKSTLSAGTPGIALAMSDTMTWVNNVNGALASNYTQEGAYGLSLPLVEKGIPLGSVCLDRLYSADQLKGVKILLLGSDMVWPQNQTSLQILSDWVRGGGVLLSIGGQNGYDEIQSEWWNGSSPFDRMLSLLGLDDKLTRTLNDNLSELTWRGPAGYGDGVTGIIPYIDSMYLYALEGSGQTLFVHDDGQSLGMDFAVGSGHAIFCGLPSSYFARSPQGPDALRSLVEYATRYTDVYYQESNVMAIRRGDYLIAHALEEQQVLTGQFVDLFDASLPLITSKTVDSNSSAMLYDVSSKLEGTTPRLLFTGGTLTGPVTEESGSTRLTLQAPIGSVCSTRLAGNGLYPQSVSVVRDGQEDSSVQTAWNEATGTLLVQIEGGKVPAELTVVWGSTPAAKQ